MNTSLLALLIKISLTISSKNQTVPFPPTFQNHRTILDPDIILKQSLLNAQITKPATSNPPQTAPFFPPLNSPPPNKRRSSLSCYELISLI